MSTPFCQTFQYGTKSFTAFILLLWILIEDSLSLTTLICHSSITVHRCTVVPLYRIYGCWIGWLSVYLNAIILRIIRTGSSLNGILNVCTHVSYPYWCFLTDADTKSHTIYTCVHVQICVLFYFSFGFRSFRISLMTIMFMLMTIAKSFRCGILSGHSRVKLNATGNVVMVVYPVSSFNNHLMFKDNIEMWWWHDMEWNGMKWKSKRYCALRPLFLSFFLYSSHNYNANYPRKLRALLKMS